MPAKHYYGDVLEDADDKLKYDEDKPWKVEDVKLLTFKVKSAINGFNVSQALDMVKGKTGGQDIKHKCEVRHTPKCMKEHAFKLTTSSSSFKGEWEFSPKDLNTDGKHASVEVEGDYVYGKNEWEGKAEFKLGGFKLGPISPWNEVQFNTNHKQEHQLTLSQNLIYEQYHAAWRTLLDVNGKKMTDAYGILALKNSSGDFYLRSNCLQRLVSLGWFTKWCDNGFHCYEVQYDFKGANRGIMDLPLFARFGWHYHLNNGSTLSSQLFAGNKWWWTSKWDLPITKQIKVTVQDQADVLAAFQNPKDVNYNVGVHFEFKL